MPNNSEYNNIIFWIYIVKKNYNKSYLTWGQIPSYNLNLYNNKISLH